MDPALGHSRAGRYRRKDRAIWRESARRADPARKRTDGGDITPSLQPDDAAPPRRKLVAYSGRYRIEGGNRFVTDVDIAWLPAWVGTPRGRNFMLKDGELHIVADPAPVEFLDGAIAVGRLVWAREDANAARDQARV